jgi:hypothetical protein
MYDHDQWAAHLTGPALAARIRELQRESVHDYGSDDRRDRPPAA